MILRKAVSAQALIISLSSIMTTLLFHLPHYSHAAGTTHVRRSVVTTFVLPLSTTLSLTPTPTPTPRAPSSFHRCWSSCSSSSFSFHRHIHRHYHATTNGNDSKNNNNTSHDQPINIATTINNNNNNNKINYNAPLLPISTIKKYIGPNQTIATKPFTWDELQYIVNDQKDLSLLSRSQQMQSNYIHYMNQMREEWDDINDLIAYTKFGDLCISNSSSSSSSSSSGGADAGNCMMNDGRGLQQGEELIPLFKKVKCDNDNDNHYDNKNKWKIKPSIKEIKEQMNKIQQGEQSIPIAITTPITNTLSIPTTKLLPNDFPYYVDSNVNHWCLWKLNDNVTEHDIQRAIEELEKRALMTIPTSSSMTMQSNMATSVTRMMEEEKDEEEETKRIIIAATTTTTMSTNNDVNVNDKKKKLGKVLDTLSWINPKHLQSIPGIDHAHILCLREVL